MYVILPSHIEVIIPVAILVWLFFFIPRFKRMKTPRNLAVNLLVLSTITLLTIQMVSPNDIGAYEQGQLLLRDETWNLNLGPGGVYRIGQISNYYVLKSTSIMLDTNNDVRFYLVDENSPEERHNQAILTDSDNWVSVRLPYLYTEPNVIANWSMYFENPSQTRSINVMLTWDSIEDNLASERWSVRYWPHMPSRILVSLWVFFSLGFVARTKPLTSVDQLAYQNIRLLGYFGVWVAIFGGIFLWSLAGLPLFIGLGLPMTAVLWVFLAEYTFSFNLKEEMSNLGNPDNTSR